VSGRPRDQEPTGLATLDALESRNDQRDMTAELKLRHEGRDERSEVSSGERK
jgi:hypothetical protein